MQNWQLLAASKLNIAIHQSKQLEPLHQYNPHRGIINSAVFNHTNKVIASCGQDSKIELRSSTKYQQHRLLDLVFHSLAEEPTSVNCLQFSNKSKYIAAGAANGIIKIWDMKSHKDVYRKMKGHSGAITSLDWMNGEDIVVSSSTSGQIYLHKVNTGGVIDSLVSKNQQGYNKIQVSEGDGFCRLVGCTVSGSVLLWDLNATTRRPMYIYQDPQKSQITSISISAFKPVLLASTSLNSTLTFIDIQQKKVIKSVTAYQPLTSVAFHSNGHTIAVGGINGGLWVYDLRKLNQPVNKYNGHNTAMKTVSFSTTNLQKQKDNNKQSKVSSTTNNNNYTHQQPRMKQQNTHINTNKGNTIIQPTTVTTTTMGNNLQKQKQSKLRNLSNNQNNQTKSTNKITLATRQVHDNANKINKEEKQQKSNANSRIVRRNREQQEPRIKKQQPISSSNNIMIHNSNNNSNNNSSNNININNNTYGDKYLKVGTSSSNIYPIKNTQEQYGSIGNKDIRILEQKLVSKHSQLREQMHDRFDALHIQIIRQMQLNMKAMVSKMEEINYHNKQLESKVKRLQNQNQNLRKRTY